MSYDRDKEIVETLLNDDTFKFVDKGKFAQGGICPNCNRKSLWFSKDKPGRIQCNHESTCKPWYNKTPREIYPELFENYAERHPATEEDPKATARAYLEDRHFNPGIIAGWYDQGYYPLKNQTLAPTVRITLWNGGYWERLIDRKHIAVAGKKNHFKKGTTFSGKCWTPPELELEDDDECFIAEGIFNAWVFLHMDRKAIASFSSNNLPVEFIEKHRKRGILWTFAFDNDPAGLRHMQEFADHMKSINEQCRFILTRNSRRDWNDEWIAGSLDEKYLNEGLWRGCVAMASSARDKAFWLWARKPRTQIHLEYRHALYSFKVEEKAVTEVNEVLNADTQSLEFLWSDRDTSTKDIGSAKLVLAGKLSGSRISNCVPRFLYIERDPLTDDQDYFFTVTFRNGNPKRLIALDGSSLKAPSSFDDALLNKTSGGTFDGEAKDLKRLKQQWFDHKTTEITRLRFVGHDLETNTWVFPEFGFHNNRFIPLNDMGFIEAGQNKVKTKVGHSLVKMIHNEHLDESWIGLFEKTFGPNGLIVMAWWLCTLFVEIIRHKFADWPFMELTGEPGTGKTTLLKFLWRCVGRIDGYEGFDPAKSTVAGRSRSFERYSGLPCVLIEADRASDNAKKAFDFNEIKDFFNGGIIRTTGVKNGGNETVEPNFRGGVLVAQNASIDVDDEAVMERIVHCHSTKAHHTRNSKQFARQMASMKPEDVAGWLHKALTNEKQFLELYERKFAEIQTTYQSKPDRVRERIIENHAKVAAGIWCLKILFPIYMTDSKCQELEATLWQMAITREQRIKADSPLVAQFWDYYEELNHVEFEDQETREYRTAERLNHSSNPDYIAINLVDFAELVNKRGLERLPMQELKKQLPNSHSRSFVKMKPVHSQITGKSKKCWVFRITA